MIKDEDGNLLKRLYTREEAAEYIETSPEGIDLMVEQKKLRRVVIDDQTRYDVIELERFKPGATMPQRDLVQDVLTRMKNALDDDQEPLDKDAGT